VGRRAYPGAALLAQATAGCTPRACRGLCRRTPSGSPIRETAVRAIGSGSASAARRAASGRVSFRPTTLGHRSRVRSTSCVCHGDAFAPNTLIGDDGRCCGHVDPGDLGVADRWADIAVCNAVAVMEYSVVGGRAARRLRSPRRTGAIEAFQRLWNAGDISSISLAGRHIHLKGH